MRDGCRVRFWEDVWCNSHCLKTEFLRLYSLSKEKRGSLHLFAALKETSGEWRILPRRELFEWEMVELQNLFSILSTGPSVSLDRTDYPKWTAATSGLVINIEVVGDTLGCSWHSCFSDALVRGSFKGNLRGMENFS
ncbi:uncharacterized protein LOC114291931 [Camellia sinensis]|uniref:uncharacterized protein LOC114291931 n=1 Tax=Camellia sinensis TaxID=4442 RepID=UPI001035DA8D|nr:uncharacterized protein LOC114291931 [Camellia sinensis]